MKIYKKILVALFVIFMVMLCNRVYAAGVTISVDKTEVEIGSTFTVTITGTGAASYDIKASVSGAGISDTINLNAYTDDLSNGTKTTSKTYTAKQKGTVNISIKSGSNVTVSGAKGSQSITGSAKTVSVIDKKVVPVQETKQPTTQETTTPKTTETKKTTTNNKKETKKTETKKTEVVETHEEEEATPQLGIASLKVIGVKETGEEVEIPLDKEFDINTFEYACKVEGDISTIKIQKEAYEYNDLVQIIGLEEPLKLGENVITLKLAKDDKEVTYVIKLTKEQPQEEVKEVTAEPEEEPKKEQAMVSMPVVWFVLLELAIIGVSVGTTVVVMKYAKKEKLEKEETTSKPRRKRRNEM